MNDPFVKGVIEGQRANQQQVEKVLQYYGK
jgi:hypothetical protein